MQLFLEMLAYEIKMTIHVWQNLMNDAVDVQLVAQSARKMRFIWMQMKRVFFILLLTLQNVYGVIGVWIFACSKRNEVSGNC